MLWVLKRHSAGPDMCPNFLKRFSADNNSHSQQGKKLHNRKMIDSLKISANLRQNQETRPIAQSVVRLIADSGVMSWIMVRSHTFVEIYGEIFSMVILLLLLIQEGLVSVTSESMCTKYWLNA